MRLCSQPCSAEELAHKDDLALLFSAITTWCPEHNVTWRKSAGEVLMTVSRHGLSIMVVNYMHKRRCLTSCIDNMRKRMHEFSSGQACRYTRIATIICFSSKIAATLLLVLLLLWVDGCAWRLVELMVLSGKGPFYLSIILNNITIHI